MLVKVIVKPQVVIRLNKRLKSRRRPPAPRRWRLLAPPPSPPRPTAMLELSQPSTHPNPGPTSSRNPFISCPLCAMPPLVQREAPLVLHLPPCPKPPLVQHPKRARRAPAAAPNLNVATPNLNVAAAAGPGPHQPIRVLRGRVPALAAARSVPVRGPRLGDSEAASAWAERGLAAHSRRRAYSRPGWCLRSRLVHAAAGSESVPVRGPRVALRRQPVRVPGVPAASPAGRPAQLHGHPWPPPGRYLGHPAMSAQPPVCTVLLNSSHRFKLIVQLSFAVKRCSSIWHPLADKVLDST